MQIESLNRPKDGKYVRNNAITNVVFNKSPITKFFTFMSLKCDISNLESEIRF